MLRVFVLFTCVVGAPRVCNPVCVQYTYRQLTLRLPLRQHVGAHMLVKALG